MHLRCVLAPIVPCAKYSQNCAVPIFLRLLLAFQQCSGVRTKLALTAVVANKQAHFWFRSRRPSGQALMLYRPSTRSNFPAGRARWTGAGAFFSSGSAASGRCPVYRFLLALKNLSRFVSVRPFGVRVVGIVACFVCVGGVVMRGGGGCTLHHCRGGCICWRGVFVGGRGRGQRCLNVAVDRHKGTLNTERTLLERERRRNLYCFYTVTPYSYPCRIDFCQCAC